VTIEILDWRHEQPNPPPLVRGKRKHLLRGGEVVVRDPSAIDGVVIHQTACTFAKARDQPTRHHRAFGVACHALAFRDRKVVLPNPLRWYVQHGNGFNPHTLGLEVEGLLPGLEDDPTTVPREDLETTWKRTPDELTDDLVATACEALRLLVELGRAEGMPIEWIYAHRQSGADRRSDPGQGTWRRVVLGYAVRVLGLKTDPARVVRNRKGKGGRPIPRAWDPAGVGRY
jgi:hypothetical protein